MTKIESIINEKGDTLEFSYGTDQQRIKTVLKSAGKEPKTTYYIGDYELEETSSYTQERNYIYGKPWVGIYVKDSRNTKDSMYYVLTDHLGSFEYITNEKGEVVQKQSFDAWGNRRNPDNWLETDTTTYRLFFKFAS